MSAQILKAVSYLLYRGMGLKGKTSKPIRDSFAFRVKMGDYEIEIGGDKEQVLKTIEDMPALMSKVHEAFEIMKPRKVTTLTVKTEASKDEKARAQAYPKIALTEKSEEAVLRLLETDWGKWRPRTIDELKEALKANGMGYSGQKLARVLAKFAKRQKIRRWKTDSGYVYILAEKEASHSGEPLNEEN